MADTPTDIVLGVALAADPQKYQAAAERLRRLSAEAAARADAAAMVPGWSLEVSRSGGAEATAKTASPMPVSAPISPPRARNTADAFGQLEAFVLQSFIQSMLPKNADSVFGKGTAGEVWKSMLAEKLSDEIARSGQLGIAKRLASSQASVTSALLMAQGQAQHAGDAAGASASPPSPLEQS